MLMPLNIAGNEISAIVPFIEAINTPIVVLLKAIHLYYIIKNKYLTI
ncbi:hypothetical protein [Saccharolobus islandicus]|nr:hypothetical protein [Sulfolobus islandicus]